MDAAQARVLVIGAEGLGSAVLGTLAASGVGRLAIVGGALAASDVAARAMAIDPRIRVEVHDQDLQPSNALELFEEYDLVVDGSGQAETRYLANDAAVLVGVPLVWGSASGWRGRVGLTWAQHGPHYRDLQPQPPGASGEASPDDGPAHPALVAAVAGLMAAEAVKVLTGEGEPLLGRALLVDAAAGRVEQQAYERAPYVDRDPIAMQEAARAGTPFPIADDQTQPPRPHGITNGGTLPTTPPQPSDPSPVITPAELAAKLRAGESFQLVDVREPWEADLVQLAGSRLVPLATVGEAEFEQSVPVIVYCHHGVRSERARRILEGRGLAVRHLIGGIDAYALEVDPDLRRY